MRARFRSLAERVLTGTGTAHIARHLYRRRTAILCYHNVVPDDAGLHGERLLHTPLSRFRRDLDLVSRTHDIVSLDDALRESERPRGRPQCCITFDDAYVGTMELGLAELARRKLPATVFIAPGLLDRRGCWWDLLANDNGVLEQSVRQRALLDHGGDTERVLAHFGPALRALPRWWSIASLADLRGAADTLFTFGAHTWAHVRMVDLPSQRLAEELRRPLQWLDENIGAQSRKWLAYPYGLFSEEVARAAETEGYEVGLTLTGRLMHPTDDARLQLPRIPIVAGLSERGQELRIAGVL